MNEDEVQASDPLLGRAQVRIFTLADHAAEEPSGKLYISGGGLEWIGLPTTSDSLLSFYVVIRLAFPMDMVRPRHVVEVRALDRAGQPVGPEPLLFHAELGFDLKHAPT